MYAMHYEITLPADYDMGIIRHRVATRGHLLDAFPGLGLKAYLIRERAAGGSPVNQYAPFYLWRSIAGMSDFLTGPGFQGIIDSFGRPPVGHWTGLAFERGPSVASLPRVATKLRMPVPANGYPAPVVDAALARVRVLAETASVHSTALAIDPGSWELIHFTLWEREAPESAGVRYQVLHLSTPELADLAVS